MLFLDALKFLTDKDNQVINPIFRLLSLQVIQNVSDILGYLYWLLS